MSNFSTTKFLNFLAYFAIVFAGIALVLSRFVRDLSILSNIASLFAFIVAGVSAFYYARSKRSPWWMVVYIIFAIVVLVMMANQVFNLF